ncbi:growth hormone secretagogue receptor type 1-like [Ptychodera flava]|uniref:growth hormone secretagogue receptor type 1-like n=1 Tax=Ptychodera flava TaxID=63121 RepID=UPI00396AAAE8
MRTATNAYLVNLAVADLLHLSLHWYTWICAITDYTWLHQNITALCVDMFLSRISQYVSLFTVTVLSLERYMAFCKPHAYREGFIHKRTRVIQVIVFVWSLAVLLSIEQFVGCMSVDPHGKKLPELIFESIYVLAVFSLMCAVLCVYSMIIRQLQRLRNANAAGSIRTHEHQIMRVCLTTALTHFTFTLPFICYLVTYLLWRYGDVEIPQEVILCLNNLVVYSLEINSSSNILIYNAMSSKYRKAFKDAFSINFRKLRHCKEKVQNVRRPTLNSPTIDKEMTIFSSGCSQHCPATSATNF